MTQQKELIPAEPPESLKRFAWLFKIYKRLVGFLRRCGVPFPHFFTALFLVFVFLVALKIALFYFRGDDQFKYEFSGIVYEARDSAPPTVLEGYSEFDVKNISKEPRYLKSVNYVLWRSEFFGMTWSEGSNLNNGTVYLKEGGVRATTTLPILFQPNEIKHLAWHLYIPVDDVQTYSAYAERSVRGVFSWPKRSIALLIEDTRDNLFDQNGKLVARSVIDTWWVYPNNKSFFCKTLAVLDLFIKIVCWKIQRFVHYTS